MRFEIHDDSDVAFLKHGRNHLNHFLSFQGAKAASAWRTTRERSGGALKRACGASAQTGRWAMMRHDGPGSLKALRQPFSETLYVMLCWPC